MSFRFPRQASPAPASTPEAQAGQLLPGEVGGAGDPARALRRLEHLYEIGKLFLSFESVEKTFDEALGIATRTLPLRSAILVEVQHGRPRMILWPSRGQDSEEMRAAKAHVERAYAYFVGVAPPGSAAMTEEAGATELPRQPSRGPSPAGERRFVVLPLVIRRDRIFGALQVEANASLDEEDLVFVNAVANQLAIALDRDHAWRREIARRERAEQSFTAAEAEVGAHAALALEHRRLYEEAQQAIRVREQVLAVVSHDLRNPLGTILMASGLLARRDAPDERPKDATAAVERIQRGAQRMLRLIDDLLDFANIDGGRLSIRRVPQDPGALLDEALASFEAVAREKGLVLAAEPRPRLPDVSCDPGRVLQVLSNLVGNAVKVTAPGGRVALRARARGEEVEFAVSDTGPGLSADDVTHLFERYWRSEKAQYKGSGLGLAIARGIVHAHGGRVWAESELGRGSTFYFTLPVFEPEGAGGGAEAALSERR